jgi:hypothetical protein
MMGALLSRAASRAATTVEDEVTFCCCQSGTGRSVGCSHNGWDGEFLLLGILEESEDIVAHNDTGLPGEDVLGTHICSC